MRWENLERQNQATVENNENRIVGITNESEFNMKKEKISTIRVQYA